MILRLTQKLVKKYDVPPRGQLPLDPNPYADWSVRSFTADRTHYLLVCNTVSLYSVLTYARGLTNDSLLIARIVDCIREVMHDDGLADLYDEYVAPATNIVQFSKALNRQVTGWMNNFVHHADWLLSVRGLSPHDASFDLHETPLGKLPHVFPKHAIVELAEEMEGEVESGASVPPPRLVEWP